MLQITFIFIYILYMYFYILCWNNILDALNKYII